MNIIVAVGVDPEQGETALYHALDMYGDLDATIEAVHVDVTSSEKDRAAIKELLESHIDESKHAAEFDYTVLTPQYEGGKPKKVAGEQLVYYAEEKDGDLLIMGHHTKSFTRSFLLGSASDTAVAAREIPVTLVP